jgi:hypothetical protein
VERTNYVQKAKQLIQQTARTAALVIVPLAAAVNAHAITVVPALPTGNFSCQTPNGSCSGADAQLAAQNGIQGVKFYTNGFVDIFVPASGGGLLILSSSGPLNGTIAGGYQMPLFYDFTLSGSGNTSGMNWTLMYSIQPLSGPSGSSTTVSGSGVGTFTSNTSMTVPSGGFAPGNYTLQVAFRVTPSAATDLSVNVPTSSFDFNAVALGTPEPATGGIAIAGVAAMGITLMRRRRK